MKKIVKGNDFTLKIPVMKSVEGQKVPFPLPACTDVQVRVCNQFKRISLSYEVDVENDNVILARVEGDQIPIGTYAIEVKGKIFGNDWRSNEYPQFAIVTNNADADTEFGETDEGDNSVEMDTAMVILPPSVELSDLISDANEALGKVDGAVSKTDEAVKKANDAVSQANGALEKVQNVDIDIDGTNLNITRPSGEKKEFDLMQLKGDKGERGEKGDKGNAFTFADFTPEELASLKGEKGDKGDKGLQGERGEQGLPGNDGAKGDKGEAFKYTDFTEEQLAALKGDKGDIGLTGPQGKTGPVGPQGVKGDPFTYSDFTEEQIKELQKPATDAATKAQEILKNAEIAINGAETVNAKLENYILSVTDREGNTNEINLNADETVNLTITSLVEGINVAGMKVNVYLNNGKTPTTYTTDSNGHVTFNVERGTLYRIEFNEYGNAQPISPISYTATSGMVREISVEYKPYDEESSEKVVVTVTKYGADNHGAAYEGIPVSVTYDKKTVEYQSDSKGQVTVYVPYGKEYTVKVENQEGYYVSFNKNTRSYTATVPQRLLDYRMYQFKAGIFVVDDNLNKYYIDDWVATGRDSEEVVALKVADSTLMINKGTFMIRTSDLRNMSKLPKLPWCTQQLLFTSIASNGNVSSDANYYNGESSTFLIRQEAQERSLSVPAADYAYNQVFCIGGQDLHGFKMSAGQEFIHMANASPIKQILTTLYGEDVGNTYYRFVMNNWRWTSTQGGAGNAWMYSSGAYNSTKTNSNFVLPVFACP